MKSAIMSMLFFGTVSAFAGTSVQPISSSEKSELAKLCTDGSKLVTQTPVLVSCALPGAAGAQDVIFSFESANTGNFRNRKISCSPKADCIRLTNIKGLLPINQENQINEVLRKLNSSRKEKH